MENLKLINNFIVIQKVLKIKEITMEYIKDFLKNEDRESFDKLQENCTKLVWIDWREYDEDIINYIENVIQSGKLIGKNEDTDNKMGFNIIIEWNGKKYKISYPNEEGSDRDTTIKTLNKVIQPEYEIRLFMESLGSDTLAFVPLSKEEWEELEKEFGEEKVNYYFSKIKDNSKMFDLDMDELFKILDKRKEIKNFFDQRWNMEKLRVDDFEIEENDWGYIFSTYFDFWGEEVGVTLDLDYNIKDEKEISEEEIREVIEKTLKNLNPLLKKAENNRNQLIELLKEKDYIELANEWIAGAEEVEGKEGYYLIDDEEVHIPITEEEFEKSISCRGGIGATIGLDGELDFISIYFVFEPDYFAGHCIEGYINEDGSFSINGLAGQGGKYGSLGYKNIRK